MPPAVAKAHLEAVDYLMNAGDDMEFSFGEDGWDSGAKSMWHTFCHGRFLIVVREDHAGLAMIVKAADRRRGNALVG